MPLDRECSELLRCLVRDPNVCDRERFADLVKSVKDWDSAIMGARKHGVHAILFSRIVESELAIPSAAMARLCAEYESNVFHNLANAAELIAVLKAFEEAMIPLMPFKGVVLGASVYQSVITRPAGDIDVLIFRRDLARATEILLGRGYSLTTSVPDGKLPEDVHHYEYHFERQSDGMVLELRWRLELTPPRYRRDLGMEWVWKDRQTTTVAGATVPDMNPIIALLALCMHGSKHRWSRLIWTCDVARLLERHPDLEWARVNREAKRTGLWRALALGVLLAHRVAAAQVPQGYLRAFEADNTARELADHFGENLFRESGTLPESREPYNVRLLGPEDRIRLLFTASFLQPSAQDRAVIKLPKLLAPLYYLIRPLRILLSLTGGARAD